MRKFLSVLAGFLFWNLQLVAQPYFFKVLGIKGLCKADNQLLKVGTNIRPDQTIFVPVNGYLGLAHYSGKTLELKNPGTYRAKDLESKIKSNYTSDMQRYFDIVLNELISESNIFERRERLRKASSFSGKGAVTRQATGNALSFVLPSTSKIYEDTILIRWYVVDSSFFTGKKPVYRLKIMNMLQELLYETQTSSHEIVISFQEPSLQKETHTYWYEVEWIENPDISTDLHSFNKISPQEEKKIKKEIGILPTDGEAIGQLILARYLEDKGLLANALFVYKRLLEQYPIESYQEIYQDFLVRNHMLD
ncbi:MAG: hypothetical protein NZM38_08380 [Cytophagales bacterium]|nr:hypothetical protein [Cytophagales bacterium]MDW8384774.1 hypothetical protein [Flammeovirgaceae bacterium]